MSFVSSTLFIAGGTENFPIPFQYPMEWNKKQLYKNIIYPATLCCEWRMV